jgi:ribosomal protein S18 acetylase RimI-like enzyme
MKVVADEGRWIGAAPSTPVTALEARIAEVVRTGAALKLEHAGELIGAAFLHPAGTGQAQALGMWILPGWRGRGGGRMLLDAAIDHARASGARRLELEVFDDNAPALALYRSAGFEVETTQTRPRGGGPDRTALLMARPVDPPPRGGEGGAPERA